MIPTRNAWAKPGWLWWGSTTPSPSLNFLMVTVMGMDLCPTYPYQVCPQWVLGIRDCQQREELEEAMQR